MAWGRICRVVVKSPAQQVGDKWEWTETDIASLDLSFSVTRSRVFNDNYASVTIYNMTRDTRNRILKRGSNLLIYAGYKDEGEGLMFQGNIVDVVPYSDGADSVVEIHALAIRSLSRPFTATPVAMVYPKGATADRAVKDLATALGLVPIGADNVASLPLDGFAYVGGAGGALEALSRRLATANCGLYIDLAELLVYKKGGADSTYSVAYLATDCGLLSARDTTDYMQAVRTRVDQMSDDLGLTEAGKKDALEKDKNRIIYTETTGTEIYAELDKIYTSQRKTAEARVIIMPKVRPNSLVDLQAPDVSGLFVVDSMTINGGNTPDADFTMTLSLVEAP